MTDATLILTDGHITVGNSSGVAVDVAMSGDVTIDDTGATTITDDVTLGGFPITSTGGLFSGTDGPTSRIATTNYVDSWMLVLQVGYADNASQTVRLFSDSNLSADYDNGSSGVGATLTNNSTQTALTIDGVAVDNLDYVLIAGQSSSFQNGMYRVTDKGSGSTNWVLTRSTTYDTPVQISNITNAPMYVSEGNVYGGQPAAQQCVVNVVGTDPIIFYTWNAPGLLNNDLTSAHIYIGNASNIATKTAITGDVTISDTGVTTIKSGVVLSGSPTTTTQSPGDNSTKIATTAYADAAAAAVTTSGISVTITTAALTPGGSQGSMTFTNGILTAQTQAT